MSNYALYKCQKKYVDHLSEVPQEIKDFLDTYDGDVYLEDEDTLKDLIEDDDKLYNIVKAYWDKKKLWSYDLCVELD